MSTVTKSKTKKMTHPFPSVFSTLLMTPTATVCLMSRTAKRPSLNWVSPYFPPYICSRGVIGVGLDTKRLLGDELDNGGITGLDKLGAGMCRQ